MDGQTTAQTYGFDTLTDVLGWKDPTYLVDGVLSDNSLAVIYGPSRTGKSFVVIDLMFHVALGRPWLDRETAQGVAVYVFGEGGAGIKQRARAWLQAHGVEPPEDMLLSKDVVNLHNDEAVVGFIRRLKAWAEPRGKQVRLVVFDTLARCAQGVEENSNRDMGMVVANADAIRKAFDATVLLVHHTGKDADRGLRGASALLGALDTSLVLSADKRGTLEMAVEKQKDGPDGIGFAFAREIVDLDEKRTSCVVRYVADVAAPSNDNSTETKRRAGPTHPGQIAMLKVIESLDPKGEGVPWDKLREHMKTEGPEPKRSSDHADWRKALKDAGHIVVDGDRVRLNAG